MSHFAMHHITMHCTVDVFLHASNFHWNNTISALFDSDKGLLSNEYGLTIWFSQDELMLITHQSIMTTTNDYAHVWLCSECSCLTLGGICWLDTHLVRCIETHLFSFRCSRHVVSVKDALDAIYIPVAYIYVNKTLCVIF